MWNIWRLLSQMANCPALEWYLFSSKNDKRKCGKKRKKKHTKKDSYTGVNNCKEWNKHRGIKEFFYKNYTDIWAWPSSRTDDSVYLEVGVNVGSNSGRWHTTFQQQYHWSTNQLHYLPFTGLVQPDDMGRPVTGTEANYYQLHITVKLATDMTSFLHISN